MKKQIKRWSFRLTVTGLFILALLIGIVLNPGITYASSTAYNNYTIFHDKPIDKALLSDLDKANDIVKKSELYDSKLKLDICLKEDSKYPAIVQSIFGRAFATGFYNKVVVMGNTDYKNGCVEINGYKWNLVELLAHEVMHCYQFNAFGLLKSNPIARIPTWKWEGYPEYIARQGIGEKNLAENIKRLTKTEQTDNNGWLYFPDSTGTVMSYYKSWLLMQYCMDIKKMSYRQVLADTTQEKILRNEMMGWYKAESARKGL